MCWGLGPAQTSANTNAVLTSELWKENVMAMAVLSETSANTELSWPIKDSAEKPQLPSCNGLTLMQSILHEASISPFSLSLRTTFKYLRMFHRKFRGTYVFTLSTSI